MEEIGQTMVNERLARHLKAGSDNGRLTLAKLWGLLKDVKKPIGRTEEMLHEDNSSLAKRARAILSAIIETTIKQEKDAKIGELKVENTKLKRRLSAFGNPASGKRNQCDQVVQGRICDLAAGHEGSHYSNGVKLKSLKDA